MGLEALLSGKPAYVFGSAFYTYHPLCRKVANFDDLRERIQKDRERPPEVADKEFLNLRFAASYVRHTIPGSIAKAEELTPRKDTNHYAQVLSALRERARSLAT